MRPSLVTAVLLVATSWACKAEPAQDSGPEPMRKPVGGSARGPVSDPIETKGASEASETSAAVPAADDQRAPVVLPERPRADPDIDRALDLINGSGLRFIDRPSADAALEIAETDGKTDDEANQYTAEQFATMLRTKWDWVGYDIIELDPWLDEIATSSFKTSVPYQVVYGDGTVGELRVWLDQQLQLSVANEGEP